MVGVQGEEHAGARGQRRVARVASGHVDHQGGGGREQHQVGEVEERRREARQASVEPEGRHEQRTEVAEWGAQRGSRFRGLDLRPVVREKGHGEAGERGAGGHAGGKPGAPARQGRSDAALAGRRPGRFRGLPDHRRVARGGRGILARTRAARRKRAAAPLPIDPRSAATSRSKSRRAWTTAARLLSRIPAHSRGELPARRLIWRKAGPARRSAPAAGPLAAALTIATLASCGRWLSRATIASWRRASKRAGRAPRRRTSRRTLSMVGGPATPGQSIQGAPTKRPPSACPTPERSEPAIGWPPTKRRPRPQRRAAATIAPLVLPTSVTRARGGARRATRGRAKAIASTGMARITRSQPWSPRASEPAPACTAPRDRARRSTPPRSTPTTRTPGMRRRTARPIEPPISPTPTMAMRRNGATASDRPADGGGDDAELGHQLGELLGVDRLRAVGERHLGLVVHLDHDAVRSRRHGRARHRDHLVAETGSVARVREDRQMAQLLDDRDGG